MDIEEEERAVPPLEYAFVGLFLTILTTLLFTAFGWFFSFVGVGASTYIYLTSNYEFTIAGFSYSYLILIIGFFSLFSAYVTFSLRCLHTYVMPVFLVLGVLAVNAGALMLYPKISIAPLAIAVVVIPAFMLLVKQAVFPGKSLPNSVFFKMLALAFTITSAAGTCFFAWWAVGNMWDSTTNRARFSRDLNCYDKFVSDKPCLAAYMTWISPQVLCIAGFVWAMVCAFLGWAVPQQRRTKDFERLLASESREAPKDDKTQDEEVDQDADRDKNVEEANRDAPERKKSVSMSTLAIRAFLILTTTSLIGMWVAASIAGSSVGLANVVITLSSLSVVAMGIFLVFSVGWVPLKQQLSEIPTVQRLVSGGSTDLVRSLLLISMGPPFGLFLLAAFIKRGLRRTVCSSCRTDAKEAREVATQAREVANNDIEMAALGVTVAEENPAAAADADADAKPTTRKIEASKAAAEKAHPPHKVWLTPAAHSQFGAMLTWNWTSVLTKMMYWGMFFVVFNVGIGKVTSVFLSWLGEILATLPLYATLLLFYVVGIIMFLLPPVPGVPVYIAGGIVLVSQGKRDLGYLGSMVVTIALCFSLKMLAITIQQKLIGEGLSGFVGIRKLISVNSQTTKAIRVILSQPGLKWDKVSVLIGGPDWPTSVTTGILKLNLGQMLLGSTPVLPLVITCVCASAFLLERETSPAWNAMSSLTLAVAAALQGASMVAAGYAISNTLQLKQEEIAAIEDDEEVLVLDRAAVLKAKRYAKVARWAELPMILKLILIVGAILMTVCCYMIQLFGSYCFEEFELTHTIAQHLDGNVINLVKPVGWVAVGIFCASCLLLMIFRMWVSCNMPKASLEEEGVLDDLEELKEQHEHEEKEKEAREDAERAGELYIPTELKKRGRKKQELEEVVDEAEEAEDKKEKEEAEDKKEKKEEAEDKKEKKEEAEDKKVKKEEAEEEDKQAEEAKEEAKEEEAKYEEH